MRTLVSVDFFVVPTVLFKVLFVFVVLVHDRRRVVHINVTDAPTAQWTANQLVEAFPWETAPRYLLRDRDAVYGVVFLSRAQAMGIHEVKTAPRSPWQNPYVERLIGTLRRECLDHMVVLNETHLRRLLRNYLTYYHGCRTHLALEKDAPEPRAVGASIKAGSSRRPWSAASIIATHARRRKILPACGCTRHAEVAGRPVTAVASVFRRLASRGSTKGVPRSEDTTTLTNGRSRSSDFRDGLNGSTGCRDRPRGLWSQRVGKSGSCKSELCGS